MANTTTTNRRTVEELIQSVLGMSLDDNQIDSLLEGLSKIRPTRESTRTKSFRLPTELLEWLEQKATINRRSPNAQLIEILQIERTRV